MQGSTRKNGLLMYEHRHFLKPSFCRSVSLFGCLGLWFISFTGFAKMSPCSTRQLLTNAYVMGHFSPFKYCSNIFCLQLAVPSSSRSICISVNHQLLSLNLWFGEYASQLTFFVCWDGGLCGWLFWHMASSVGKQYHKFDLLHFLQNQFSWNLLKTQQLDWVRLVINFEQPKKTFSYAKKKSSTSAHVLIFLWLCFNHLLSLFVCSWLHCMNYSQMIRILEQTTKGNSG